MREELASARLQQLVTTVEVRAGLWALCDDSFGEN
ncbi:MAG: hypothetical protein ACI85K_000273 [Hyphomicrobiaceae bacterium]|jgi:hypothetical protein